MMFSLQGKPQWISPAYLWSLNSHWLRRRLILWLFVSLSDVTSERNIRKETDFSSLSEKSQKHNFIMKNWTFLVLLVVCLHGTSARLHSLKYFLTGSSGIPNFPEFTIVGLVDDEQIVHYDSYTRRAVTKQDWMGRITEGRADYWMWQTVYFLDHQQDFKVSIGILKQHFNQSEGVHIFQRMFGCQWDDETGDFNGYDQYSYDGDDFMVFDLKTETWIAAKPQAVVTKHKWDNDKAFIACNKYYLTQEFPEWLKKYVDFGKSSLMRTELPSVSLLQKTSSSPVRCLATGFYPRTASLVWRRDGVEIHEDVEHGEILPNQDGTFQMSVDLDVSSVRAEDWGRWDCVFQLSGVKENMVTRLDRAGIRTNEENPSRTGIIIGALLVILVLATAVNGFLIYRRKNGVRNHVIQVEAQPINQLPE
ncbi:uncharacterized protein V6R79_009892 [Siganus canaliculatus]